MTSTAVFTAAWSGISIYIGARFFALMCLVMALTMAFLGGYLYRQRVLESGRLARLKMFRLQEDRDAWPTSPTDSEGDSF